MYLSRRVYGLSILVLFLAGMADGSIPENYEDVRKPVLYAEMVEFLEQITEKGNVNVSIEGKSVEGRSLYLVHFPALEAGAKKLFFFAQQHGNEPAGKDALIYLIKNITEGDLTLSEDVDLYIMPMLNPDGAEKNQRRNANDADLNRDHVLLLQPETRVLHRTFRKIMPHISVDCHEFQRDSRDYREKGWLEWPQIMMDYCNNPLFNPAVRELGHKWCLSPLLLMKAAGINYTRYQLGGVPPEEELRHSTPEIDDARNGLGTYGGLSFIIESGIKRAADDPDADLHKRIQAYLLLFRRFIEHDALLERSKTVTEEARDASLPAFIPVNYFWGSPGLQVQPVDVIDRDTKRVMPVETANFMNQLIVKKSVQKPEGYIIPAESSSPFKALLDRHAIKYHTLEQPESRFVEACKLLCIEPDRDNVYNRYGGRQIVVVDTAREIRFDKGSVFVSTEGKDALRTTLLLEPLKLYGLFQYNPFKAEVNNQGILPVYRIIQGNQ